MNAKPYLLFMMIPVAAACESKWNFEDGDGDGISAAEGDCWDKAEGPAGLGLKGSDIYPGATETWYDGFDQDCAGDDDYDADADGFIPDAYVGLATQGLDESGFLLPGDCWDEPTGPGAGLLSGADIHPDAEDAWYDGVDQDCAGDDDYDADGDGYVADAYAGLETVPFVDWAALPAGDCNDDPDGTVNLFGDTILGAEISPDPSVVDPYYDGVDQDCGGDDDFDQDGDGDRSSTWPDAQGLTGTDCFDDELNDVIPVDGLLAAAVATEGALNADVLAYLGVTAADIYGGADDPPYDGLDQDCRGLDVDCDVDGDGFSADGGGPASCIDDSDDPLCAYAVCPSEDCDDDDRDVKPDPTEGEIYFNGFDDNCDLTDGDGDEDGDGYWAIDYAERVPDSSVAPPFGKDGDCNDADDEVWPGFPLDLPYDGIDSDCEGNDDYDSDRDGYVPDEFEGFITEHIPGAGPVVGTGGLPPNDCNDEDPLVNPGVNEECGTAYDDDCDTDTNDQDSEDCTVFFADGDDDGFGDPADSRCYCTERDIYNELDDEDCDPSSATTFPGSAENDLPADACRKDDDADGFGDDDPPPGVTAGTDCDDGSDQTFPGAAEVESATECQRDADLDGYGDVAPPSGVTAGLDCDDDDLARNPGVNEDCGTDYDDDCDDDTNDLDATTCIDFYADRDVDGFGHLTDKECRCEVAGVYNKLDNDDCDDGSATTYPGAAESESSPDECRKDDDADGFGDDDPLAGVTAGTDCDDGSDQTFPGAAEAESATECQRDEDFDGYGDVAPPSGVTAGLDCDDDDLARNPGVNEDCGTDYDDDCDDDTNDLDATTCIDFYADRDVDGFGHLTDKECRCEVAGVYNKLDNDDCDDGSATTYPGAAESESSPDECRKDDDADGFGDDDPLAGVTAGTDCDDGSDQTFPGAAEAESATECQRDEDFDGYGDVAPPSGVTAGLDCDDDDSARNPGVNEDCGTDYDDDCDDDTNDLDAAECIDFYADRDNDDFGHPTDKECRCEVEGDYNELDNDDCDDGSDTTFPGAAESESSPDECRKDDDEDGYGDDAPPAGVIAGTDCDDTRDLVNIAATETCATPYDDDCDADVNDLDALVCIDFYADRDGDDFGHETDKECRCQEEDVYNELDNDDCDDDSDQTFPGAAEAESATECQRDEDLDGYGDVAPPGGVTAGLDCDDDDLARNPGVNEDCGTDYDDDCDDDTNDLDATTCIDFYADRDIDGFGHPTDKECRCEVAGVYNKLDNDDCDDDSDTTFPGSAEMEGPLSACRKDSDGDGYGDSTPGAGVTPGGDCDDADSSIYTTAPESCDAIDSDCDDSLVDEFDNLDSDEFPDCIDDDKDGDGVTEDDGDCDDFDPSVFPGATESVDDGVDSDCDSKELCFTDADDDGYAATSGATTESDDLDCFDAGEAGSGTPQTDCDDSSDATYPGAAVNESAPGACHKDDDGDGYGDDEPPAGVTAGTDCDDENDLVHTGITYDGNSGGGFGTDNDCDGLIDEDTVLDLIDSGNDVLVFSEMMVNPQGTNANEKNNEWFELTNVTDATTLFLDNWLFEMTDAGCLREENPICDSFVVYAEAGLVVGPGETLLFCFNSGTVDAALAASAPDPDDAESCDYNYGTLPMAGAPSGHHDGNFRLINAGTSALAVSVDGIELDAVDHRDEETVWPDSSDSDHQGQSIMFDGALLSIPGIIGLNDDGGNWCFSESSDLVYDPSPLVAEEHNRGTPGIANPSCADAASDSP